MSFLLPLEIHHAQKLCETRLEKQYFLTSCGAVLPKSRHPFLRPPFGSSIL